MTEEVGLRARKKLRTRELIFRTAVRLFEERGYEATTVAEIAEAADVATKTFFNYFRSKEDLLFSDHEQRAAVMLEVVESRAPGEPIADLVGRLCERLVEQMLSGALDWDGELLALRTRLIMTVPSLQARALKQNFDVQSRVAEALYKAYGDRLGVIGAAAVVGVLVGGAQAAAVASIELGQPVEQRRAAILRGLEVSMRGVEAISAETTPSAARSSRD
ncbi:MAG TPA: helix-turn-helix domain-containing protein [Streptosporangiales bacterium]